ncbi:hypothetical protein C8R48DRAFT_620914 [Suillus tomentosus]|nr:hypothetical protein C8R48DRAFT_620914 [Suillus tomentosus]
MFINSADKLFGLITTIRHSGLTKHIPWSAFAFGSSDWDCYLLILILPQDANEFQQYFSSESQPTLWHAIPASEELKMAWERKRDMPKYELYQVALQKGLDKVNKYYQKMVEKHVYVLVLVLHPYYKLEYIKMTWGGHKEQEHECMAGNLTAVTKNNDISLFFWRHRFQIELGNILCSRCS